MPLFLEIVDYLVREEARGEPWMTTESSVCNRLFTRSVCYFSLASRFEAAFGCDVLTHAPTGSRKFLLFVT